MDLLKLLSSLEDLVVEVALWMILFPRTLFAAIFTPVRLAKYFDRVETIPRDERNDEYMSPVLFWILLAPISLVIALMLRAKEALAMYGPSWQEQIGTAILMMLGPPLGFALAYVLVNKESVSRFALRRQFSLQCYFTAPLPAFFMVAGLLGERATIFTGNPQAGEQITGAIGMVVIGWLTITQIRVATRNQVNARAFFSVGLGCALAVVLMFAIMLAVVGLLALTGRGHIRW